MIPKTRIVQLTLIVAAFIAILAEGHSNRVIDAAGQALATAAIGTASSPGNLQAITPQNAGKISQLWTAKSRTGFAPLVISPDRRFILVAADILDASNGTAIVSLNLPSGQQILNPVFSADGSVLFTVYNDGVSSSVQAWDTATGKLKFTLEGHTKPVNGITISPDGKFVATVSYDNSLRLWDAVDGKAVKTLIKNINSSGQIHYMSDGKGLYVNVESGLLTVDPATGKTLKTNRTVGGTFTPNGKFVFGQNYSGDFVIWNVTTSQPIVTFDPANEFLKSEQGSRAIDISVTSDGKLMLFGRNILTASGGKTLIKAMGLPVDGKLGASGLSPDNKFIVTTSATSTIQAWGVIAP